jgi:hypothetical protein
MPIQTVAATWESAEVIASVMASTREAEQDYPPPCVAGRSPRAARPTTRRVPAVFFLEIFSSLLEAAYEWLIARTVPSRRVSATVDVSHCIDAVRHVS